MFTNFFLELRQAKVPVSIKEYLALMEAMEKGVSDYKVDHLLRVLIGKPAGTTPPGMRAFFFADGEYLGQDAISPSGKLRAGRQLEREITLVYTLYEAGDRACCPQGGDTRVHFRWSGDGLQPREPIPPDAERLPPT